MEKFHTIILGLIQGLTEFLPLSSSGHLVIFQKLFGLDKKNIYFDVALHFGTLLAVFTYYFKSFKKILFHIFVFPKTRTITPEIHFFFMVCLGTLPAAFFGWFFNQSLENLFSNLKAVSLSFCITGFILFLTKSKKEPSLFKTPTSFPLIGLIAALSIGFSQALAIIPGISRSGITIATGLLLGLKASTATLFSFSLSVPIILGAFVYQIKKHHLPAEGIHHLGLGIALSYISGLVGLFILMRFLNRGHLKYFSYYLWALGGSLFLYSLF